MLAPINNERFRNLLLSWPEKAIQILYNLYFKSLLTISEKITLDRKVSEDIVQETFTHVWEKRTLLGQQREQSIQYYLLRVVKNKSITAARKKEKFESVLLAEPMMESLTRIQYPADSSLILRESNRTLRMILSTFPKRERECLLLKVDEGLSVGEIATRLRISKKAVERSLTSAKKRIKKYRESI